MHFAARRPGAPCGQFSGWWCRARWNRPPARRVALQQIGDRIKLQLDAEIADGLRRFDKRAAHIMMRMSAWRKGRPDSESSRWPPARRNRGRDHQSAAAGHSRANRTPRFSRDSSTARRIPGNRGGRNRRVRKRTARAAAWAPRTRGDAFGTDDHHLAGLHIVQVDRADQVEGASLGSEHVALASTENAISPTASGRKPWGSRATMMRSSARNTSETPLPVARGRRAAIRQSFLGRVRHQVENNFGIAVGLKIAPLRPNSARNSAALVMLPLWPPRLCPVADHRKGLAFSRTVSPAVE